MKTLNIDRTYGHIDEATGDAAPHTNRSFTLYTDAFEMKHQEWTFPVRLPFVIWEEMKGDWEKLERLLDTPQGEDLSVAEFVIASGHIMGAPLYQVQAKLQKLFTDNLYRMFCERQIALGNKAWLVPKSLQETGNPYGE